MTPASILAIINGLISTAFNLYKFVKSIAGEVEIPPWSDILQKAITLQGEIDEAGKGSPE